MVGRGEVRRGGVCCGGVRWDGVRFGQEAGCVRVWQQ